MRGSEADFPLKISISPCSQLLEDIITVTGTMNNSDALALRPLNNSNLTKNKEKTLFDRVMLCKAPSIQRIVQLLHGMAQKGCRRAFELFCCGLDSQVYEKITCCPAQPKEDTTTQVTLLSPPSTILILNISNSTLIDCVIGNETYPSAVAESQPLMQEPEFHMSNGPARCSCSHGQQGAAETASPPPPPPPLSSTEPSSINIHDSHLNCVIIGDNNYMHAEQTHLPDTDEPQV